MSQGGRQPRRNMRIYGWSEQKSGPNSPAKEGVITFETVKMSWSRLRLSEGINWHYAVSEVRERDP